MAAWKLGLLLVLAQSTHVAGHMVPQISTGPGLEALGLRAARWLDEVEFAAPLHLSLGATAEARDLVSEAEVADLATEAFLLRSKNISGQVMVACAARTKRAVGFAFFEFLQQVGFGFLHPLKPVIPARAAPPPALDMKAAPRWAFRGTHYHTQHPLELTNFLNGYDVYGRTESREGWREAWAAWEEYLDWMLAQKQNYLEWMLLADRQSPGKEGFEVSAERQQRLRLIIDSAHALGLEVGADVPLVLKQQHALNLLPRPSLRRASNDEQVRQRVRWLLSCGFDRLGTELGSTEFTRGLSATEQVHLLNVTQEELGPRQLLVKNHCSTKQHADGFWDPRPDRQGEPLNFNYLNYYANPKIVSMPHTVQAYSLTDPAPTYGNTNFSDLREWTRFLLQQGRPMVFYPETAYWVNYDISVPLFLAPTYASDRFEDAETLDTMAAAPPLGQLNFESGWQYGYWLANAAQARVAWQTPGSVEALFLELLGFLPPSTQVQLSKLLAEFAREQRRLLIHGRLRNGAQTAPAPGVGPGSATAIAYLQGSEGLSDLASLAARYLGEGAPQPDRLHFAELWAEAPPAHLRLLRSFSKARAEVPQGPGLPARRAWFEAQLRPLLLEANTTFAALAAQIGALSEGHLASDQREAVQDLADSAQLLSLRCSQVLHLYEHAAWCSGSASSASPSCQRHLTGSRDALRAAQALVSARSAQLGLDVLGAGAKRMVLEWTEPVPTAYSYGYLWAATTLFYWRRDQTMVENGIMDPCFGTINDPVELGLSGGGGPWARWARSVARSLLSNRLWHAELSNCLGPKEEPNLPGLEHEELVV
mmetsp:Transcript_21496/g.48478  ORF Transcript_21496/g.48478 Transcript_21496/m.48478 type:complete len:821 (-) Transcript_21496:164-2626(-)